MYIITPENAASTKISVTSTATALFSLMDTAGSITTSEGYYNDFQANAVLIKPEDGDIRVLSKATPTTSVGFLLKSGTSYYFPGLDLSSFNMIRTGSTNVSCSIQLGKSTAGESWGAVADNVSLTLDEFPAAAVLADNISLPTTTQVGAALELYDGTNLDLARAAQTSNSTTVTGFQNMLPMGRYNATPTARTEGQFGNLQTNANGDLKVSQGDLISGEDQTNNVMQVVVKPLASSTYAPTVYTNVGSSTTANIKATAGNVFSLSCLNTNASVRYLLLFNSTGATTTVVYAFPVPASGGGIVIGNDFFTNAGHYFSTGITFGISTSATSYVAATASEHVTAVSYF